MCIYINTEYWPEHSFIIWICEGTELTLDKFKIFGWIISSSFAWLSLRLGHEEKNISYRITDTFFNLVGDILRIWNNYDMFILLVIIIGLAFVIILNCLNYWSFFLTLFIWSYFAKKWSLFSALKASAGLGHSFLSFLMGLFVGGLCGFCWLLLLLREQLLLFFFFLCWLCWFLTFQSFLEFLLSQDFFSFLNICAEALFRYHCSFPWKILIDFPLLSCSLSPII